MHLGEQLIQEDLLTREQLETALKAQLQFGGRIGTNLLELGFVDPDTLARALSRKLGVPPALYKHFGTIETSILGLFSAKFADRYKAIPLGLTMSTPHRLVVAFMDPMPANIDEVAFAVGKRIEPGVAPELLIVHCLERFYGIKRTSRYLRVDFGAQQALPQVAGQAPPPPPPSTQKISAPGYTSASFKESRPSVTALKSPYVAHSAAAVQAAMAVTSGTAPRQPPADDELLPPEWLKPAAAAPPTAVAATAAAPPPAAPHWPANEEIQRAGSAQPMHDVAVVSAVLSSPAKTAPAAPVSAVYAADGTARMPMESIPEDEMSRAFVGAPALGAAPDASSDEYGEFDPNIPVLEPYESLAPAAVARISEYDPTIPLLEPYESIPPVASTEVGALAQAAAPRLTMPIAPLDDELEPPSARRGMSLDEATFAIAKAESKEDIGDALCEYLKSSFGVGLVLILKDDMALGWKGFATDVDDSIVEAISVPVTGPSMFKTPLDTRTLFKGAPPSEGAAVQTRLWKLLRCVPPHEVVVAPIVLGKRVVNLVYGHGVAGFSGGALLDTAAGDVARVCEAASAGYTRLIRTGR